MFKTILNWYEDIKVNGIKFFYAYDAEKKGPSATLFYCYISFYFVLASIIGLHFKAELLTATSVTIGFFGMCMIFYRLRKIDKVKFDLQNKSVDLENNEKDENA